MPNQYPMTLESQSNSKTARIAASFFFLVGIPLSLWGQSYVSSVIFVAQDPKATAINLLANEFIFRMSIASHFTDTAFFVAMIVLFYGIFRPVDKNLARMMLIPAIAQIPIVIVLETLRFTALMVLKSEPRPTFDIAQQQEAVYFLLRIHRYASGPGIGKFVIGLCFIPFGMLVLRSRLAPKVIGILLIIGGVSYVIDCATSLLLQRADYLVVRSYLLYGSLTYMLALLWFLLKGVRSSDTNVN
jgi:hypothetical protein